MRGKVLFAIFSRITVRNDTTTEERNAFVPSFRLSILLHTYSTHPRAGTWHIIHTYGTYLCMRRIALVAGTQVSSLHTRIVHIFAGTTLRIFLGLAPSKNP